MSTRRSFLGGLARGAGVLASFRAGAIGSVLAASRAVAGRPPDDVAADEDYWREIQQAFTLDRSLINLNNGGVSPSPRVVQDAMRRYLELSNEAPVYTMWQLLEPQIESVRRRLASAFGCDPEEMAITRNASEALEICMLGLDLKPGDEVLTSAVTFFVGENGTGKSTVIEAIAALCRLPVSGGSRNELSAHHGPDESSPLASALRPSFRRRPRDGYFLRAESFFNVATYLDIMRTEQGGAGALAPYGGRSLHEQSHGESFLALMTHRFQGQGLYILDEPEAALSPKKQLLMLRRMQVWCVARPRFRRVLV